MKVAVIICTLGRPQSLQETVMGLRLQTLQPTEILIGTPSLENVTPETLQEPGVRFILTPRGSTLQRNRCMSEVAPGTDVIQFLDDDMELTPTFLAATAALYATEPTVNLACGTLLHDGSVSEYKGREFARTVSNGPEASTWKPGGAIATEPRAYGNGCVMSVRASVAEHVRFDENLPLYAWLEDSDFSHAATKGGRGPVTNLAATGAHIGSRGGRVAGRRLGFSQMVNPFYLWRKDRVFTLSHVVVHFWARCLVGNVLGLVSGEPGEDRPGRVVGNLLGILHLLSGKADPMHVLTLPAAPMGKASRSYSEGSMLTREIPDASLNAASSGGKP